MQSKKVVSSNEQVWRNAIMGTQGGFSVRELIKALQRMPYKDSWVLVKNTDKTKLGCDMRNLVGIREGIDGATVELIFGRDGWH